MENLSWIALLVALIAFGISAIDVRNPPSRPNWMGVGLVFLAFALLLARKGA